MLVVDGARVSVSRHSDSKVQKIVKGAQAQYIGKVVCGAGNEIDREASTTHSGRLASSFKKKVLDRKTNHHHLVKTETEEIFRGSTTAIPEASFAWQSNFRNAARQRMRDSKTFHSNNKIVKERIWITVKLTVQNRVAKVDVEMNARN